jgi:hypothetical protein
MRSSSVYIVTTSLSCTLSSTQVSWEAIFLPFHSLRSPHTRLSPNVYAYVVRPLPSSQLHLRMLLRRYFNAHKAPRVREPY